MARRKPSQDGAYENIDPKQGDAAPPAGLWEFDAQCAPLLEQMRDAVVILQDSVCKYANGAVAKMVDYEAEEIVGRPFADFIAPESMETVLDRYRKRMEGKPVPTLYEASLLRKDGTAFVAELSASIVGYEGRPADLVTGRDVTEHKQAEEELRNSEERLRILFEYAPDAHYLNDMEGVFVDGNRAAEEIIGYARSELIGKSFLDLDLLSSDDISRAVESLTKNRVGEPTGPDEYTLNCKDGSHVRVEIRTFPVKIGGQDLVLGSTRDITERKRTEDVLRESEGRFRLVAENVRDAIFIADAQGQARYVNPSYTRLLGYSLEEAKCLAIEDLIASSSQGLAMERLAAASSYDEQAVDSVRDWLELEYRRKDGSPLWGEVGVSFLWDADGQLAEIIGAIHNVTERKQAEEALRESEERYRAIFEHTGTAMVIVEEDTTISLANREFEILSGYSKQEIEGRKRWTEFIHQEDLERMKEYHRRRREPGAEAPTQYEFRFLDKAGEVRNVLLTVDMIPGTKRSVASLLDITKLKKAEEQTLVANERLQYLLSATAAVIYTAKTSGDYGATFISDNVVQLMGYEGAEFVNSSSFWIDHVHPDDRERILTELPRIFDKDELSYEYRFQQKDGDYVWVRDAMKVVRNDQGEPLEIVGFWTNVTEHKMAEEALRESEAKYSTLVEQASDGIVIAQDGEIKFANRAHSEITGYSVEEMIGTPFLDVVEFEFRDTVSERQESRATGERVEPLITAKIRCKDGTAKDIESSTATIQYQGRPATVIMVRDITERKRAEEVLRESEKRYRLLAENVTDVIFTMGLDMRYTYVSPSVTRLRGFSVEEVMAGTIEDTLSPHSLEKARKMLAEELAEERKQKDPSRSRTIELEMNCKDGAPVWTEVKLSLARDTDGQAIGLQGVTRDITERKQAEQALRASEEKYRLLFEGYGDPIAVYDTEGRVLLINEAGANNLDASPEDLVGKPMHEFLPERAEVHVERIRQVVNSGKSEDFEDMVRLPSGERWFWSRVHSVRDREGNITAVQIVNHDITERKRAEGEVRRLAKFPAENPNPVLRVAKDGTLTYANEASAPLLRHWACQVGERLPADWSKLVSDAIGSAASLIADVGYEGHTMSLTFAPVVELEQVNVYGLDITERKKAEELLQQRERYYCSLIENASDSIAVIDSDGIIRYESPAYQRMLGYSLEERAGRSIFDRIHPDDMVKVTEAFTWLYENPSETARMEVRAQHKDGSWRIIEAVGDNLLGDPAVEGIVANIADITERRQMEEELRKIDKLESVGTLAGGIAHDFNNLLTGIVGNVGLAKNYVGSKSEAYEVLLEAERASLRAKNLTQQLLTFAKGSAPVKELASIHNVVVDSATFALRGSNVRCQFDLPDDLWSAEVDVGQISQVLNNLVINADEAMPEGGTLHIAAKNRVIGEKTALPLKKGNYVEITLQDQGIGISREHLGKIFDPYFTTKQKGSGLGLASAYSIVKDHEGHITAESELGIGTTFLIYLPATKKRIRDKKQEAAKQTGLWAKGRILVMDDEEMIRKMLRKILPLAGYEVEVAKDGAEAIDLYAKARESGQPFDVVILDLTIPGGMGGKETIKKLLEIDPDVKAIVSSGYSTDPIMSNFREYGFSAVAAKPYSIEALEETLGEIMAEKKAP